MDDLGSGILEAARCLRAGRPAEVEALCHRILAGAPPDPAVLARYAEVARRQGLRGLAAALAGRAVAAAPASAPLFDLYGQLLNEAGDYAAAVEAFERAVALDPALPLGAAHLARARHDLAVALDPDYAPVEGSPWAATDAVWQEAAGNRTLLVLFAGLGIGNAPPTFIFRKFLAAWPGVDKLFLRDPSRSWYQLGLPGVTADVPATAAWLRERCAGYDRTLFLGCSAGGMAAMLFGGLAGAGRVLAFAPQTVLSDRKRTELGDERWEGALARLRASAKDARWLDLPRAGGLATPTDIYYPAGSPEDSAHATAAAGPNVRLCPQPGASHVIALEMRDDGRLKAVIDDALR